MENKESEAVAGGTQCSVILDWFQNSQMYTEGFKNIFWELSVNDSITKICFNAHINIFHSIVI